jgi:hypothetical protein
VLTCPWMAWGGKLQPAIKLKLRIRWMNCQLHWIQDTRFQLVGPSVVISLTGKPFVGGYSKLWFSSMRHSAIYEWEVNFQEHYVRKLWVVYSIGPWKKQMCKSLRNFVMLLGLDFMLLEQSVDMSLDGLRRQVATRDKTQTKTWMDEPSVALD